jgi:hypothetical protein
MQQIIKSQNNIVEKVLRDKEGRLVRARFAIYENAGRIKARLLDFVYIEALKGSILSLSNFIKESTSVATEVLKKYFTSPFFAFNTIYYSGSKPRAPTF